MKRRGPELVEEAYRAIVENGPLSLSEIANTIGNVTRERMRKLLEGRPEMFETVGQLLRPGTPPQHLWGIVGLYQELVSEPQKQHPFDPPKHSIVYRDMMKNQRVKYDRY